MAKNLHSIYQLKITLQRIDPPIWRRLMVSGATDLEELHDIFQIVMGWNDSHLHEFIAYGARYGTVDPEYDDNPIAEKGIMLSKVLKKEGEKLTYHYDFGDNWIHEVVLEKILFPYNQQHSLPLCIEGKRCCPPDDVGSISGYESFLEAYNNKNHPEHKERVSWVGGFFDSELFDCELVNTMLKE